MESEERALRAQSFGAIAEDYDRFRPGPPSDAVSWLLPATCTAVVDIGAGTGALTRQLVGRVPQVWAVEPDARMRAVLAARVPGAEVLEGQAEAIPLPDAAADAVLGSSMWHWVDAERAVAECARVLRPGGILGLLWSGPDRSQGWMAEVLAEANPRRESSDQERDANRRRYREVHLPAGAPFGPAETHKLEWSQTVTRDALAGLAGTYSRVIRLPESERARLHDRLVEVLRNHPALAGRDEIEIPMRCACWRATRT